MMSIKEMHFMLKSLLSKTDSKQYRNINIPELDLYLNDALHVYVNNLAFPYYSPVKGAERQMRITDALKALVTSIPLTYSSQMGGFQLPDDYWHYLDSTLYVSVEGCDELREFEVYLKRHDITSTDILDNMARFYECDAVIRGDLLKPSLGVGVDPNMLLLEYIKKHPYMHYAEGFNTGSYTALDGTVLTGYQDCLLSKDACMDIVTMAAITITTTLRNTVDTNLKLTQKKLRDE